MIFVAEIFYLPRMTMVREKMTSLENMTIIQCSERYCNFSILILYATIITNFTFTIISWLFFLITSNLGNCSWKRETSAVYIWTWKSALGRKGHKRNSKDVYIFLFLHSHWRRTNLKKRLSWKKIVTK